MEVFPFRLYIFHAFDSYESVLVLLAVGLESYGSEEAVSIISHFNYSMTYAQNILLELFFPCLSYCPPLFYRQRRQLLLYRLVVIIRPNLLYIVVFLFTNLLFDYLIFIYLITILLLIYFFINRLSIHYVHIFVILFDFLTLFLL